MKKKDAFGDSRIRVPFFVPEITKEDKMAVNNTLDTLLLTDGPILKKFEKRFARFTGAKYAIGVSNATAALHLSLKALGIGRGDEVIVPDMTFVATASAILMTEAVPVLADVDETDMNISVASIQKNLTKNTKAILPVHFAGKSCKIDKIMNMAKKNRLKVIEDCAHAIGTKYKKKHVGTFGDAGCFSFYPTKNLTTIEGGMIITNSKKIADYVVKTRNHGIDKSLGQRFAKGKPWDYDVHESGYNYRLDEVRSSLGISQLKRICKMNLQRKKAAEYYTKKLENIPGITTPRVSKGDEHVFHLYIVKISNKYKMSRDMLFEKLLNNGIRTSVHYKPLHKFTVFQRMAKKYSTLLNSEKMYERILSLPMYSSISRSEQDVVIKNILA